MKHLAGRVIASRSMRAALLLASVILLGPAPSAFAQGTPPATASEWVIAFDGDPTALDSLPGEVAGWRRTGVAPGTYVIVLDRTVATDQFAELVHGLPGNNRFEPLIARPSVTRAVPTDPLFGDQWHLENTGQSGGTPSEDANVLDVWDADYTGAGVVIGIVDDGLQHAHPDLQPNYDPALSYDFNDDDADPSPSLPGDSHGTAVAGVAAAAQNNGVGVSGVAPGATLAGLRLLGAPMTDLDEAEALSYRPQDIDIYTNSWGPPDNGRTLDGPGMLTSAVLADGVANGRDGLGSIYVWAAGNGLTNNDNVNYDGYANSRYTIAATAVDHTGEQAWYAEPGAPILVAAHSSGDDVGITTTDLQGTDGASGTDYRDDFGGTSSAAPLVAGVVANMLEANPDLGWRDVQHLLIDTARKNDPTDSGWAVNGAGRDINHKYGHGVVDAAAAVDASLDWVGVGEELVSSGESVVDMDIPDSGVMLTDEIYIDDLLKVEWVEVIFSATHTWRGDLEVVLTSPMATQSILASVHDDGGDDYSSWSFTSARYWGELSQGLWSLNVRDGFEPQDSGIWDSWALNVFGTQVVDVPEPGTLGLFFAGWGLIVVIRRRRPFRASAGFAS